ncbi:unnamed protein product, partial [Phaeothamnion confervicola]
VAARDLSAGEVAFREAPFAAVVARGKADHYCSRCCAELRDGGAANGKANKLRTAYDGALPPLTAYCGPTCEMADAAALAASAVALRHVQTIAEDVDIDVDLGRLLVNILVRRGIALGGGGGKSSGSAPTVATTAISPATAPVPADEAGLHNLLTLVHHADEVEPSWTAAVAAAAERVLPLLPSWARCGVPDAVALAARVNANAHGLLLSDGSNASLGCGMFPLVAMLNHSCSPNCAFVFCPARMEVRVLRPVAAGEELTVAYIDLLQSTADRQRELLQSRHFECRCARCLQPPPSDALLAAFCCASCGEAGVVAYSEGPQEESGERTADIVSDAGVGRGTKGRGGGGSGGGGGGGSDDGSSSGGGSSKAGEGGTSNSDSSSASGGGNGSSASGGGNGGGSIECTKCGVGFDASAQKALLRRAQVARRLADGAPRDLRAKKLQAWLEEFDAGTAAPRGGSKPQRGGAGNRGGCDGGGGAGMQLHPSHTLVLSTLVAAANCRQAKADPSDAMAAVRHLRRVVAAMESAVLANWPELADFRAGLANALVALLQGRGAALPARTREQCCRELKAATARCAETRAVCYGRDHPSAVEAAAAAAR